MSPDGYGGSVLEHSAADGVTAIQTLLYSINHMLVIILYNLIFQFIAISFRQSEDLLAYDCPVPIQQLSPAQQLHWNISKKTAEDIEAAKRNIDKLVYSGNCVPYLLFDLMNHDGTVLIFWN